VRLAAALDAVPVDRASVAAYLDLLCLWYRDALCLAVGAPEALLVNLDEAAALGALAAERRVPALVAALARIRAAWVALDANVNPRLVLETALVGEPVAA
jgi:hypothetical protein